MTGVAMSAVRAQGGAEREAMRAFAPLPADHPSIGNECAVCGGALTAGDVTTIIPLGPGADEDDQRKAADGRWYACIGVIAHAACAGLCADSRTDSAPARVWIVTRWEPGGGGDDDRVVVGVYGSEATARDAAQRSEDVTAYTVKRPTVDAPAR